MEIGFSYGRALQTAGLMTWEKVRECISQDELSHRAEMNKLASLGQWEQELEDR